MEKVSRLLERNPQYPKVASLLELLLSTRREETILTARSMETDNDMERKSVPTSTALTRSRISLYPIEVSTMAVESLRDACRNLLESFDGVIGVWRD